MASTKVKVMDKGMKRVRKVMEEGKNPLSEGEVYFIRTCCRILGVDNKEKIDDIGKKAPVSLEKVEAREADKFRV
jgi:hypothetical protein